MGRSRLHHVDNPAVVGHSDTDTPACQLGKPIPGLNVPHDGDRGTSRHPTKEL